MSSSAAQFSTAAWMPVLEGVVACPACHSKRVSLEPRPACAECGWIGRVTGGILDFVDENKLESQHHAELEAQSHAVGDYYENEEKLSCHWDRMSADRLPGLLGWPSGLVLDLGTGTGTAGAAFRRSGARVIGADLSVACLDVAQKRLDAVVRADATRLPFADASFDNAIARGALHHLADPQGALREVSRVLKPGARVLFADPREFAWLEPIKNAIRKHDDSFSDDHHAYDMREYTALISEQFQVDQSFSLYPFGILLAVGLDLFPLPKLLPKRLMARQLLAIDELLNETPLGRAGHLVVVTARKA